MPWLQAKLDGHYPGTQLAFTEWNYGGGDHISGAIASADVLGLFGRYGVGLATYWALHEDETFAYAALRAFRNYDGSSPPRREWRNAPNPATPEHGPRRVLRTRAIFSRRKRFESQSRHEAAGDCCLQQLS